MTEPGEILWAPIVNRYRTRRRLRRLTYGEEIQLAMQLRGLTQVEAYARVNHLSVDVARSRMGELGCSVSHYPTVEART